MLNRNHLIKFLVFSACLSVFAAQGVVEATPVSFDVRDFGAAGDGEQLDDEALQRAVDACYEAGGGFVRLTSGDYLVAGGLRLRSGVHLYLEAGATILGSDDIDVRNRGTLISARGAKDIGIRGPGRIDAQGDAFWTGSPGWQTESWRGHAPHDYSRVDGSPGRPIEFRNCQDVVLKDLTIVRSPSWTITLRGCDGVVISGVTIRNPLEGDWLDGIDIVGCSNVRIEGCHIETGDDALVLKSEPNYPKVENITVTNCVLASAANGFKLGTGSHGVFRNITFSNSVIYSAGEEYGQRTISGVNLVNVDGGIIENVSVSNIVMHNVRAPLFIHLGNRGQWMDEPVPGRIRNVLISNIVASGGIITSSITGIPDHPVESVTLKNLRFVQQGGQEQNATAFDVPEMPRGYYPEAFMFRRRLPAWGLYARHVSDLVIDGFDLSVAEPDGRPAIILDRAADSVLRNLRAGYAAEDQPWLEFHNSENLLVQGFSSRTDIPLLLTVHGSDSDGIALQSNDLRRANRFLRFGEGVARDAVHRGANIEP